MVNKIINTTYNDYNELKKYLIVKDSLLVEIPGKDISSLNDYLKFIEKALRFPTCCNGIYSRYHDWIMDLSWFDYNKYFLVFNDFSYFLRDEPDYKRIIFKDFEDVILPWWEHNVTKYSVDGREKIMIIYLVR